MTDIYSRALQHKGVKRPFDPNIITLFYQKGFPRHLFRLFHSHQFDQSRRNIGQASAFSQFIRRICIDKDKRYLVRCMGGPGLARLIINQLLGIAVIGTDKQDTAGFLYRLNRSSHAGIHCLNRLDRGILNAGMAYHIRICEVDDYHIVLIRFNCLHQFITNLGCAHFWF